MGKNLTDTQIEAVHGDGFVSPVDIFSEEEALHLIEELETAESKDPRHSQMQSATTSTSHLPAWMESFK